ncbi:unnamed protein product [Danaus chrysippus]|uniref:(African queen) hypothetical protein n=1 Tax=Danaus chrysippus TaxID=151541 RepID=A0A8J2QDE5_9NEOP|nr:unnamed protein product [Danaus chrysippus]
MRGTAIQSDRDRDIQNDRVSRHLSSPYEPRANDYHNKTPLPTPTASPNLSGYPPTHPYYNQIRCYGWNLQTSASNSTLAQHYAVAVNPWNGVAGQNNPLVSDQDAR